MTSGETGENRTYLTFTLDQEDFAVEVAGVREVLDYTDVTRVPRTPDFMKGVINLRGSVVPVVDMRLKFGLPEAEKTVDTCVIVLEVELDGETTVIGAIADSVKEVFELDPGQIEPPPRLGTRFDTEFISGMGKHNDNFIIILDVNQVFSSSELEFFRSTDEGSHEPVPDAAEYSSGQSGEDLAAESDEKSDEEDLPEKPAEEHEPVKKPARRKKDTGKEASSTAAKTTKKGSKKTTTSTTGKK